MSLDSMDNLEEIIQRRKWGVNGRREEKPKNSYERAVDDLGVGSPFSGDDFQGQTENPKEHLKNIVKIQQHLDERFGAKKGNGKQAVYSFKQTFLTLASFFGMCKETAWLYGQSDLKLISEQKTYTAMLQNGFRRSKAHMQRSYEMLGKYRSDMALQLGIETQEYGSIERDLERLEQDELILDSQSTKTSAKDKDYADLIQARGNIVLERQKLTNNHEKSASIIKNSRQGVDELVRYQMIIQESEQVLGDACTSLDEVATQQAVVQAVLSAFSQDHESMRAAYQVMETLSTNIVSTKRTINGTMQSLNQLASQINCSSNVASADSSLQLYGNLRGSRSGNLENIHSYVKDLFEKPIIDGDN